MRNDTCHFPVQFVLADLVLCCVVLCCVVCSAGMVLGSIWLVGKQFAGLLWGSQGRVNLGQLP